MLPRYLLPLLLFPAFAASQPYFTPVRGAFGADVFGISPKAAFTAEACFGYLQKSYWNVQAGLGAINRPDFRTPTLSAALTHCFVLNPYKRRQCIPQPGNYLVESYLEAGLGGFLVDRYDNAGYYGAQKQRLLTPSGLAGMRFNVVTAKWIYIVKIRYTPPLLPNYLASHAGVGVALGWR